MIKGSNQSKIYNNCKYIYIHPRDHLNNIKQILTDKKEEIDGSNSIQIYKANNNRQKGRNGQQ